jgi:hypothetical protein
MVEIMAPRQIFSESFGFPCQNSFHQILYISYLSSDAATLGHLMLKYQGTLVSTHTKNEENHWHLGKRLDLNSNLLCDTL